MTQSMSPHAASGASGATASVSRSKTTERFERLMEHSVFDVLGRGLVFGIAVGSLTELTEVVGESQAESFYGALQHIATVGCAGAIGMASAWLVLRRLSKHFGVQRAMGVISIFIGAGFALPFLGAWAYASFFRPGYDPSSGVWFWLPVVIGLGFVINGLLKFRPARDGASRGQEKVATHG